MDPSHQQHLLILRLPEELAVKIKQYTRVQSKTTTVGEPAESAFTFSILPTDPVNRPSEFTFVLEGKDFPALLMNLPTPVEALKTFDNKVFLKSGDIGQILQVFRREKDREAMKTKLRPVPNDVYCPDGLTAPTADIVQRRFDRTRVNETFLNFRYQEVIAEVLDFVNRGPQNSSSSVAAEGGDGEKRPAGGKKSKKGAATSFTAAQLTGQQQGPPPPFYESVSEEVIDFEEYMLDPRRSGEARTIVLGPGQWDDNTLQLLVAHPEILITKTEEEDDELERLAQQELKKKGRQLANEQSHHEIQVATATAQTVEPQQPTSLRLSLTLKLAQSGQGFTVVASEGDVVEQKNKGAAIISADDQGEVGMSESNKMVVEDDVDDEIIEDEVMMDAEDGEQPVEDEEPPQHGEDDEDNEDWMKDI